MSQPDSSLPNGLQEQAVEALPSISHIQFLTLDILAKLGDSASAGTVRKELAAAGVRREGSGFYQIMRRLDKAGLIEHWRQPFGDDGPVNVLESYYGITPNGWNEYYATVRFYRSRLRANLEKNA